MKKLVLFILSVFVMMLFISINYLLWDRENKIDSDKSKDSSIAALGRELKNLETSNNLLRERSTKLESDVKSTEDKLNESQLERIKLTAQVVQRNELINQLKQTADMKAPEAAILKWGEAMEKAQYDLAFQLQLATALGQPMSLDDFSKQCKAKIKSFKIISTKPFLQSNLEERKGDILFKVSMDVKRITDSGKFNFEEGTSEKIISVTFQKDKNIWVIENIQ